MAFIKKTLSFSALCMYITMYGGDPENEWILVGPKPQKTIPSTATLQPPYLPSSAPHAPAYQQTAYKTNPVTKSTSQIPLHIAAYNNDINKIDNLIYRGSAICALDANGATALHWAAGNGKTEAVKNLLLYHDAIECLGIQDNEGKTPLHRAAGIKSDAILELVKHTPQKYLELKDIDGSTPLLWAASGGNLPAVKALTKRGANVDAQDDFRGRTSLLWALRMRKGSISKGGALMPIQTSQAIIRHLIDHNADPEIKDFKGYSAIYWAEQLKLHVETKLLKKNTSQPRRSERIRNRK